MKKEDLNFKLSISLIKNYLGYLSNNFELLLKFIIPLLIVLLGYFGCTYNQRKIASNLISIFDIAKEVRLSYSNKPDYWGLSTEYVIKNKLISHKFINNGKILLEKNKEIFIGSGVDANIILPQQKSFDVVLKDLTKAECISYLEAYITPENQVNLSKISVFNSKEYIFNWGDSVYSLPIKKYIGKDICADVHNSIVWSFF